MNNFRICESVVNEIGEKGLGKIDKKNKKWGLGKWKIGKRFDTLSRLRFKGE